MGNAPVKIGIRLEKNVVEAGNVLKGRVYLSVQSRDQQARGVHLVLKGDEKSLIRRNETARDRDHRYSHSTSSSILHMDVPLTSFPTGLVPSGQYEFPFEWPLPENLPSTMNCQLGDSRCSIEYHLTAYLDNSGSLSILPDYSSQVTVTVVGSSRGEFVGTQMDLENYAIKSCCAHRGTMTMGWDADTIVAAPGGTINVGIVGKNDSIVELKYLQAKLVETVTWSADGHNETIVGEIALSEIYVTDNTLWTPLLSLPSRRERRHHHYETMDGHFGAEILDNRYVAQLQLSQNARDSYLGNLIRVRHSLVVTAVTPGACCVTSPESSVLVTVQRRMPTGTTTAYASAVAPTPATVFEDQMITPSAPMELVSTYQEPPMAVAEMLPNDWTPQESEVVVIPANSVIVQSTATVHRNVSPHPTAPQENLLRDSHQIARSLVELQAMLANSKTPSATLEQKLQNPVILATIENLSPHEFMETLKASSRQDADYIRNARLLASAMVPHFYCRHVLACLWSLPHPTRFLVLREVAPLASDMDTQRSSVERELDPNELAEFRAALT
jgi:hypothetical protein